jgi:predicted acetyltransferase
MTGTRADRDIAPRPDVRVDRAAAAERTLIEGLTRFYIYDFSELEPADSDAFDFSDHGDYDPLPYLEAYWREPGRHPLVIRLGEKVVGFALINGHSHQGGVVERNMAEFFVARKYRRHGVATGAVHQILATYPGQWEVAVAQRNLAARVFWPRAIASAPGVSALRQVEGDPLHWRGPIWCFHAVGGPTVPKNGGP